MVEITSSDELADWLKDKPAEWAQVLSVRAALRVLPYAFDRQKEDSVVDDLYILIFRVLSIAWIVPMFSWHDVDRTSARLVSKLLGNRSHHAIPHGYYKIITIHQSSANCAANYPNSAISHAIATVRQSSMEISSSSQLLAKRMRPNDYAYQSYATKDARASSWANLSVDCDWLEDNDDPLEAARRLNQKKLWLVHAPHGWPDAWQFATERLLGLGAHLQVWIDWYDRRVAGDGWAFVPNVAEDNKILINIANSGEDEFWGKGAAYVGTKIQGWVNEARARQVQTPIESDSFEFSPLNDFTEEISIPKKADFFISYATVEEEMAREVEAALTRAGYTSIAQFKDFQKGNFVRQMREGIAQTDRFIALQSKAYWASDHCQAEWDAAYARDPGAKLRKIIPFLLEPTILPPIASETVYLPLFSLSKQQRKKAIIDWVCWQPHSN